MQDTPYRPIPLRRRDGSIRHAIVDSADFDWLTQWRWHVVAVGASLAYARGGPNHRTYMHRLISGLTPGDGMEVDHIDGDGLNNRRENLRTVTHRRNQENLHVGTAGKYSAYRGVSFATGNAPLERRWIAYAGQDGRFVHLGFYATELDAAAVAAQWRHANMPTTIEAEEVLAHVVPPTPEHANITRLRTKGVEIERRWAAGESMQAIADALGCSRNALSALMTRLRGQGYDLPYRRAGWS